MINNKRSSIKIKSNVSIKSRGLVPPIDNMPNQYFDVRLDTALNKEQREKKEKILFWAQEIYDESRTPVLDECYKGCSNCGDKNNYCKHPQNTLKK